MSEQTTIDEIVSLLFASNESPLFVDGTAPIEDIARDPDEFLAKASVKFALPIRTEHLKMSIPQLAQFISNNHIE